MISRNMSTQQSILLTTTSFQDVPGIHHQLLEEQGYQLIRERGPLSEERMLELVGEIDGMICGDDAITPAVVDKALPRLRVISKYGIGLDKIDVNYVTEKGIPLPSAPGSIIPLWRSIPLPYSYPFVKIWYPRQMIVLRECGTEAPGMKSLASVSSFWAWVELGKK